MNVLGICGSLRKASFNMMALRAAQSLAPQGMTITIADISQVPLYNEDVKGAGFPPAVQLLRDQVKAADALLIVSPEYNFSIPGVLKNAIDCASRPPSKNSFAHKPAGVLGASPGAIGTALAQYHLRTVLGALGVSTLAQPDVFLQFHEGLIDDAGNVTNDKTQQFLQTWVDRYVAWVDTQLAAR